MVNLRRSLRFEPLMFSVYVEHFPRAHWFWLFLVAIPLRFIGLGSQSLWYDETFTLWVAKLPWDRFWVAIRGDVHPPGWYLVEKLIVSVFGESEFALRLPSAVLGVIAVWLVWRIALALKFDRWTAFLAGLLTAMLPAHLYYSQDARMYPLLTVGVLLMVISAINEAWLVFAIGGIITVYAQNLGVFYVLGIGLVTLGYHIIDDIWFRWIVRGPSTGLFTITGGKPLIYWLARAAWLRIKAPVTAIVAIVIIWLPWAVWGLSHQAANMGQGFWLTQLTPGAFLFALPQVTMGIQTADVFQVHLYGVALGLTMISVLVCEPWHHRRAGLIVWSAWFVVPCLLAVASMVWRSVYLPRAMLPSGVLLMPLWAYTLTHLSPRNRAVALAIFLPTLLIGVVSVYFPANAHPDIRVWSGPVNADWQNGDVVYHISIDSDITLSTYIHGPAYLLPESNDLSQSLTDETKSAMGLQQARFDQLDSLGYKRAWMLYSDSPMTSQTEIEAFKAIVENYPSRVVRSEATQFGLRTLYIVDLDNGTRNQNSNH